jgi:flagellin
MAIRINTNVDALNIQRNMGLTSDKVSTALKRLSTGTRINSAKDDASGFAVANSFRAKISSMRVAYQNAGEAQSMLQTADGAYTKIHDILIRMKDLATQAASGQTDQSQMTNEFTALKSEIDRIASSTKYNTTSLVDGSQDANGITFQVGQTYGSGTANMQINMTLDGANTTCLAVNGSAIDTAGNAATAMDAIDTALGSVNAYMGSVGSYQNRLQYTMENLQVSIENYSASESTIRDADMAFEVMNFTKNQILQQSGMAMLAQANQAPQQILSLLR